MNEVFEVGVFDYAIRSAHYESRRGGARSVHTNVLIRLQFIAFIIQLMLLIETSISALVLWKTVPDSLKAFLPHRHWKFLWRSHLLGSETR